MYRSGMPCAWSSSVEDSISTKYHATNDCGGCIVRQERYYIQRPASANYRGIRPDRGATPLRLYRQRPDTISPQLGTSIRETARWILTPSTPKPLFP
ncbi:hypothetical protein EVAR_64508_1 [Eumeta japonica]|uniref:Uncharacterized protein n=1 Tax=Eumeta variegata TaxID=151549 RepID=A0A4C1Z579_EUMVA|nr:hypothetical protein EVAR_64508_1 [Eumeta japonica]